MARGVDDGGWACFLLVIMCDGRCGCGDDLWLVVVRAGAVIWSDNGADGGVVGIGERRALVIDDVVGCGGVCVLVDGVEYITNFSVGWGQDDVWIDAFAQKDAWH